MCLSTAVMYVAYVAIIIISNINMQKKLFEIQAECIGPKCMNMTVRVTNS